MRGMDRPVPSGKKSTFCPLMVLVMCTAMAAGGCMKRTPKKPLARNAEGAAAIGLKTGAGAAAGETNTPGDKGGLKDVLGEIMLARVRKAGGEVGVVDLHVGMGSPGQQYRLATPAGKTFTITSLTSKVFKLEMPLQAFQAAFPNGSYSLYLSTPATAAKKTRSPPAVTGKVAPVARTRTGPEAKTKTGPVAKIRTGPEAKTRTGPEAKPRIETDPTAKAAPEPKVKPEPKTKPAAVAKIKPIKPGSDPGKAVPDKTPRGVFMVSGTFPSYATVLAPRSGATAVSRRPLIKWSHSGSGVLALSIKDKTGKEIVSKDLTSSQTSYQLTGAQKLAVGTEYLLLLEVENPRARRASIVTVRFTTGP